MSLTRLFSVLMLKTCLSWTRVLRVLVWLTCFERQLPMTNCVAQFSSVRIGAIITEGLQSVECDRVRMPKQEHYGILWAEANYR